MEGMLNDLDAANSTAAEFESYIMANAGLLPSGMEFSAQVLTTGFWPNSTRVDLHLPAEFMTCQRVFEERYKEKHAHRRLAWQYAQGSATVKGRYGATVYDFALTTLQAVTLLLLSTRKGAS